MAITFVQFVSTNSSTSAQVGTGATFSLNAGTMTNGALVLGLMMGGGNAAPTSIAATWNGVSMFTPTGGSVTSGASNAQVIMGLINPANGTNNLVISWGGGGTFALGIGLWSFSGADQSANSTTFINAIAAHPANAANTTVSITTVSGNASAISWDQGQADNGSTPTPDVINTNLNSLTGDTQVCQHILSTTTSDSYTMKQSVADIVFYAGCDVKAAGAADTLAPSPGLLHMRRKSIGWTPLSDSRSRIFRPRPKFYLPRKTILRAA